MRKFLFLICVVMALPSIANDDIVGGISKGQ